MKYLLVWESKNALERELFVCIVLLIFYPIQEPDGKPLEAESHRLQPPWNAKEQAKTQQLYSSQ